MGITWSCIQAFLPRYMDHAAIRCHMMTHDECKKLLRLLGRNVLLRSKMNSHGFINLDEDSGLLVEELDWALELMR